jgi:U3 small nucleolar RNA-associated protein 18
MPLAAVSTMPTASSSLVHLRTLPHLTTGVDSLAFNPDGQILAMASRMKRDSLKLVHLPSLTAFSNWPTARNPLHYVHSLAFSPGGGYLAIGNAKGRVLLYRLHAYAC